MSNFRRRDPTNSVRQRQLVKSPMRPRGRSQSRPPPAARGNSGAAAKKIAAYAQAALAQQRAAKNLAAHIAEMSEWERKQERMMDVALKQANNQMVLQNQQMY